MKRRRPTKTARELFYARTVIGYGCWEHTGGAVGAAYARNIAACARRRWHSLTDVSVGKWLSWWTITGPITLRVNPESWVQMSDTQRCDVVVAHARRLRVPRRA